MTSNESLTIGFSVGFRLRGSGDRDSVESDPN